VTYNTNIETYYWEDIDVRMVLRETYSCIRISLNLWRLKRLGNIKTTKLAFEAPKKYFLNSQDLRNKYPYHNFRIQAKEIL